MSWSKLLGDLAKNAAIKYVEERGVDGIMEDAGKVASFAKKGFSSVGNLFSADSNGDGEIDADEMQNWLDSFIPEMESCLCEAMHQNVLSTEFGENIRYVLNTGYDAINQLIDVDDDLSVLGGYAEQIDKICDHALELIFNKCRGGMESKVTLDNIDKPFSMDVKGVYPVNFCHDMTIITGIIMSGSISKDEIINLPTGEASGIKFIKMFGKSLAEAECGDVCALLLDGDYFDDLEDEVPFIIGNIPDETNEEVAIRGINNEEEEYIAELKACLVDDGMISDRERRLLNRLRQSLGISQERAEELEESLNSSTKLTPEEQEYAEEVKACLEDGGEISPKERRLLNKVRESLGISVERANEIECSL